MGKRLYVLSVICMLIMGVAGYLSVTYFFPAKKPRPDAAPAYARLAKAKASKLEAAYTKWVARHERNGGDHNVVFGLGWSKAYSKEFTRARGRADVGLMDGTVTVTVDGLKDPKIWDVWLVDNQPGPGHSAAPDSGDNMLWVGTLERSEDKATLQAELGNMFENFEVDLVVVTRSGKDPSEAGVLFGSQGLFQRLYTRARTGRLTASEDPSRSHLVALSPKPAYADEVFPTIDPLVIQGANLFFNETFDGNGRTCGTCHPADNNLTIGPEFIAGLPDNDPLFVAEFIPALKKNFEKPELMRKLGLILENTNGFGDLKNNFTMRGVPHTLALNTSLTPAPPFIDGTTVPPVERTGWSGDGAPGTGTLREFANGAVIQHFTKRLNRVNGVDFILPTGPQLDAIEAFLLFTGRDEDLDLSKLNLKGEVAARGLEIFLAEDTVGGTVAAGKCNVCHENAGATLEGTPGFNANFNTGVENLPDQPADLIDAANNPDDDGFGLPPMAVNPALGTFNTPPVVEAADTGPFFHNNSIETIEGAVAFYNSDAFNNSPAGMFLGGIDLETTQVVAVAAFLRVINALENFRSADEFAEFAKDVIQFQTAQDLIRLALADLIDATGVLDEGGLHPGAQQELKLARDLLEQASVEPNAAMRKNLIKDALKELDDAKKMLKH